MSSFIAISCSISVTNSGLLNFIHVFYFIEMFSLYHQQPWRIAYNSASAEEYNPIFTVNLLNQSPLLYWNYLLHQPCQDASNHWFGLINPLFNLLVWITNAAIKTPILHSSFISITTALDERVNMARSRLKTRVSSDQVMREGANMAR